MEQRKEFTVNEFVEIYPAELSSEFRSKPVWRAENLVFESLQNQLEGAFWSVYHHPGITQSSHEAKYFRTEIDFLCSHFMNGLLVIEVKGGEVRIEEGQWQVRPLSGGKFRSMKESPFKQAERGLRNLLKRLSVEQDIQRAFRVDNPETCYGLLRRHAGVAVCFPDLIVTDDLTAELPRGLVIDKHDLNAVEDRILEIVARGCLPIRGHEIPCAIKVVLRRLFAPTIAMPR